MKQYNTIEAIQYIKDNNEAIMEGFSKTDNKHEQKNYLIGSKWGGAFFVRMLSKYKDEKLEGCEAIPIHDNVYWIETDELNRENMF